MSELLAFLAQTLHIALPLALAALGGAITERAGVVDLALESKLLFGAFAAAVFTLATGSPIAGVLGGMAAGVAVAAAQLGLALVLRADQIIVGVALNLLALGGTRYLLQVVYGEGSSSPIFPELPSLAGNPIFWLAVVATIAVPIAFVRTRWGLRLRAAGDRPDALAAVGVSTTRTRFHAALVGGALAGAGGAHLALAVGVFSADMSAGRGYIALAMVILAGWRPVWAVAACLGLGAAHALSFQLQISGLGVPRQIVPLLPYLLTFVVLAIGGTRPPPASLGR